LTANIVEQQQLKNQPEKKANGLRSYQKKVQMKEKERPNSHRKEMNTKKTGEKEETTNNTKRRMNG
jgi:hypothetical protein